MSKRTKANKRAVSTAKMGGDVGAVKPMTNLDIITHVLSRSTGKPIAHWHHVVVSSLAAHGVSLSETKLLDIVPADEAHILLTGLGREEKGILRWIIEGAMARQATPTQRHTMKTYLTNRQN